MLSCGQRPNASCCMKMEVPVEGIERVEEQFLPEDIPLSFPAPCRLLKSYRCAEVPRLFGHVSHFVVRRVHSTPDVESRPWPPCWRMFGIGISMTQVWCAVCQFRYQPKGATKQKKKKTLGSGVARLSLHNDPSCPKTLGRAFPLESAVLE